MGQYIRHIKMNEKKFLLDHIHALEETVRFFSPQNKRKREEWVCEQFLGNLKLGFSPSEITWQSSDPPDVIFRNACFEIKEILDAGRRRHDEYRDALCKAKEAKNLAALLKTFSPQDITPHDIGNLVLNELKEMSKGNYDPSFKRKLDLLFYVSLPQRFFKNGHMPDTNLFSIWGWRSISVLEGKEALVFYAEADAPEFLLANIRKP